MGGLEALDGLEAIAHTNITNPLFFLLAYYFGIFFHTRIIFVLVPRDMHSFVIDFWFCAYVFEKYAFPEIRLFH